MVSTSREATGILEQGGHTLVLLHLIGHGALHITGNVDNALVRTNHDDIIVGQADITRELAIEDIVVYIDSGDLTTATEHLDVTQGTEGVHTTGHIQGMEHTGKGTEGVSTWGQHLTHHIDGDGAGLTNSHADLGTAVALTEHTADLGIGGIDRETANMDGTIACNHDGAIGGNLELLRALRGTIDIDEHLIARTYDVSGGGGDVHIGLEREFVLIENIATKHLLAIDGIVAGINIHLGTLSNNSSRRGSLHDLLIKSITSRVGTNGSVVVAQTTVLYQYIGRCTRRTGGCSAIKGLVLRAYTLQLLHRDTTLHEACGNLTLGSAVVHLTLHILHHLSVAHLGKASDGSQHEGTS